MPPKHKKDDLGAGLRVSKDNIEAHPAGPPRYGELTQTERAFTLASTFLSGVLAISASQFLGAPLKLIDQEFYNGYMAYTKECFAILITCLTQWWAPTVVRVSGDESMRGQLTQMKDGSLKCNFADRMVLMANHQLYTDWLYLWWIAYTNNMHGFIYIILKESLKNIPIIGWSCQFYNFIFLSRHWEEDKQRFQKHLAQLKDPKKPMWLIIFPEGTNLSKTTREKSQTWAQKNGLKDMKHQLLPRSTGLRFCLQELRATTEWLYDCTIAYEGIPAGQFGQDIFTLRSSFFEGRPPKSVNMHWRRFRIDSIPIHNDKAFEVWLRNRWREKDYMLEYFNRNSRFPAADFWKNQLDTSDTSSVGQSIRSTAKPARTIETEVKSGNWNEFVKIFAPITSIMMALTVAYGASPNDLGIPGGTQLFEKMMKGMLDGDLKGLPGPGELEKLIAGAAKLGTKEAAKPEDQGKVQKLTQENLAKLVKETAMDHGIGLPGKPKARTTLTAPKMAASAVPNKPAAIKAKSAIHPSSPLKKATPQPAKPMVKPKPAPTGPMQTVVTKSGIAIKIPKPQVEEAKKTGTLVTKNGLVIKVGKKEIEEAQQRKGTTLMTASGVPIKITPSGAITVGQKSGDQKVPAKPVTPNTIPGLNASKSVVGSQKTLPVKKNGTVANESVTKKAINAGGALPASMKTLPIGQAPRVAAKK
ncbi:acyltransferase-domain-containing protein [Delitschia confertaspora ATCC 74209]|uniref:Acyltransferase-domain-containing protein n=1 Tax=Delitschia confertaspora ATCC 74209 TaxID=1513339 RepID=A0A9P4MTA4_9PLEO|nr:acyltransferase-domain-containing protein [Delitschia confertaspora ATCC 74209]